MKMHNIHVRVCMYFKWKSNVPLLGPWLVRQNTKTIYSFCKIYGSIFLDANWFKHKLLTAPQH